MANENEFETRPEDTDEELSAEDRIKYELEAEYEDDTSENDDKKTDEKIRLEELELEKKRVEYDSHKSLAKIDADTRKKEIDMHIVKQKQELLSKYLQESARVEMERIRADKNFAASEWYNGLYSLVVKKLSDMMERIGSLSDERSRLESKMREAESNLEKYRRKEREKKERLLLQEGACDGQRAAMQGQRRVPGQDDA